MLLRRCLSFSGSCPHFLIVQWKCVATGSILSCSCSGHVLPSLYFSPDDNCFQSFLYPFHPMPWVILICYISFVFHHSINWHASVMCAYIDCHVLRFKIAYSFTVPTFSLRCDTESSRFVILMHWRTFRVFSLIATMLLSFAFFLHPCLASVIISIPSDRSSYDATSCRSALSTDSLYTSCTFAI